MQVNVHKYKWIEIKDNLRGRSVRVDYKIFQARAAERRERISCKMKSFKIITQLDDYLVCNVFLKIKMSNKRMPLHCEWQRLEGLFKGNWAANKF